MSRKNEGKVSSAIECSEAVFFEIDDFEKVLESLKADSEKPVEMHSFEELDALSRTSPMRFDYHALHLTKEKE